MNPVEESRINIGAALDARTNSPFAGAASFRARHRILRLAWSVAWKLLASWTPPPMHRWRIWLVNMFGGHVDPSCFLYGSVRIWYPPHLTMARASTLGPAVECYTMGPIEIGAYAVVSQRAFLCTGTHNIHDANFQIGSRPIRVGADAWIAAEAFVGPGVTVGEGAVLGARAAAFRDLEPWTVYLGNPAAPQKPRTKFSRAGGP